MISVLLSNLRIPARRWHASRRISASVPEPRNPNLEAALGQIIAGPAFRRSGLEVPPPRLSTPGIIVPVGLVMVIARFGDMGPPEARLVGKVILSNLLDLRLHVTLPTRLPG